MRRLERQALPALGQSRLELRQRRAGQRRDHQLGGLVAGDPGQRRRLQQLAFETLAVKVLAAAAADAQWGAAFGGGADTLYEGIEDAFHWPAW